MTSEWPWKLSSRKYPVYIKYLTRRSNFFVRFTLLPDVFKIKACWKLEKRYCAKLSQSNIQHFTVKSNFDTPSTYRGGPTFGRFRVMTSPFRDTMLFKIVKASNHLRMNLKILIDKSPHTKQIIPTPKFMSVCSTTSRFRDTRWSKIG